MVCNSFEYILKLFSFWLGQFKGSIKVFLDLFKAFMMIYLFLLKIWVIGDLQRLIIIA